MSVLELVDTNLTTAPAKEESASLAKAPAKEFAEAHSEQCAGTKASRLSPRIIAMIVRTCVEAWSDTRRDAVQTCVAPTFDTVVQRSLR